MTQEQNKPVQKERHHHDDYLNPHDDAKGKHKKTSKGTEEQVGAIKVADLIESQDWNGLKARGFTDAEIDMIKRGDTGVVNDRSSSGQRIGPRQKKTEHSRIAVHRRLRVEKVLKDRLRLRKWG